MSGDLARLAARVADLERRLSSTTRTARLAYSSIEDGAIEVYDGDGALRGTIGVQPDGTVGLVAHNAPPPPAPAPPQVSGALGGLTVTWDGRWANDADTTPLDLALVQVHVTALADEELTDDTLVASLIPGGGSVGVVTGTYEPVWVTLVAVNTSSAAGPPSRPAQGTARRAAAPDILDGAVTELKLAAEAVTEAAMAAGAVGRTVIQDGAIATPHMDVGSINGDRISLNTLNGDRVVARSITGNHVVAQSLTANELAANSVTALQLAAGIVDATHIKAGSLTAGLLSADAINGKVITGSILQTGLTGRRLVVDPNRNALAMYSGLAAELEPGIVGADVLRLGALQQPGAYIAAPSVGESTARLSLTSPTGGGGVGRVSLEPSGRAEQAGYTYLRLNNGSPATGELIEMYAWAASGSGHSVQQIRGDGFSWKTGTHTATYTDGVLDVPNFAVGTVTINPSAGKPTSVRVNRQVRGRVIRAFVTANTSVPGTTVVEVSASDVDSTGLTVWLNRSNSTTTNVWWMLVGSES
ncbi:hypothetical protein ABZ649_04675 [Streptomyces albidoflavus]|uniref:hypothetical protein n=1 Tax=Streptomyces albidoflavus TaxID=1886 RepID=UPI0034007EF4